MVPDRLVKLDEPPESKEGTGNELCCDTLITLIESIAKKIIMPAFCFLVLP